MWSTRVRIAMGVHVGVCGGLGIRGRGRCACRSHDPQRGGDAVPRATDARRRLGPRAGRRTARGPCMGSALRLRSDRDAVRVDLHAVQIHLSAQETGAETESQRGRARGCQWLGHRTQRESMRGRAPAAACAELRAASGRGSPGAGSGRGGAVQRAHRTIKKTHTFDILIHD